MKTRRRTRVVRIRARAFERSARRRLRATSARLHHAIDSIRLFVAVLGRRIGRLARTGLAITGLVVIASVFLASGAFAVSQLYGQFSGGRAVANALEWAERTPRYAPTTCAACHPSQATPAGTSPHAAVRCETCHGPLGGHPGSAETPVSILRPTSAPCANCHTETAGRPAGFPVIDPDVHYQGADCLRCHDPHSVRASAPPDVTHPLSGLPACTTCHAPNGLKKIPAGHQLVADAVCLTCHKVENGGR